jgi:hypothetical protein
MSNRIGEAYFSCYIQVFSIEKSTILAKEKGRKSATSEKKVDQNIFKNNRSGTNQKKWDDFWDPPPLGTPPFLYQWIIFGGPPLI